MLNARLFKFWNDLPEALRTGKPQNETKHGGKNIFDELYADPAKLEQFLDAMTGLSRINFEALADKFDFSNYHTLCDVGGATGLLCIEVAKKHPHLECISFDLPPVEPIAKKHIAAAGLADRIRTATGDFFQDPLPKADVITMGMILHDWNLEKKMQLIRAAYDALPPGGAFVAIEALIDDARRENVFGLLMSLNMLIEFGDAFDYSGADFRKMVRRSRLQALRSHPSRRPVERGDGVQVGRAGPIVARRRNDAHRSGRPTFKASLRVLRTHSSQFPRFLILFISASSVRHNHRLFSVDTDSRVRIWHCNIWHRQFQIAN